MRATRYPLLIAKLRSYFYSGWAFLMPYLFVYLLYYVTKWPVNPAGKTQNPDLQISNGYIPCMLHVYWALHAIHVILAGFALWSWWSNERRAAARLRAAPESGTDARSDPTQSAFPPLIVERSALSVERSPLGAPYPLPTTRYSLLTVLAPWALLALLFYIPGVYLEWPSDPWEHLRRINEWRILDTVGAHSSWMKSAYFIPYSLLSWCIGLRQLFWLDFYYTGICLLLCWQYYKFSRACGLGERASMVFVIIQALLFGNNIFSFYRYYGISSSIYAQLGAVALTRIVLQFAARGTKLDPALQVQSEVGRGVPAEPSEVFNAKNSKDDPQTQRSRKSLPFPLSLFTFTRRTPEAAPTPSAPDIWPPASGVVVGTSEGQQPSADATGGSLDTNRASHHLRTSVLRQASGLWDLGSLLWLLASGFCLLALTAFNHPQGLGIAGLGIAAVIVWRLIEWKRSALWWLIGSTLIVNFLFLWLYPRPAIIETYRAQGYLNAWYGFNILDLTSPSGDRMLQIMGALGLADLACALILLRGNHVIGWISSIPFLVVALPSVAVPIAKVISEHGGYTYIVTFQRMFFAVPTCLALVCCAPWLGIPAFVHAYLKRKLQPNNDILFIALVCVALSVLTTLSSSSPSYNRAWHTNVIVAGDLGLQDILSQADAALQGLRKTQESKLLTTQAGTALNSTYAINPIGQAEARIIGVPSTESITATLSSLGIIATANMSAQTIAFSREALTTMHFAPMQIHTVAQKQNLVADPKACDRNAWITVDGQEAEFATGISGLASTSTALQNPPGATSHVFTSAMIPISMDRSFEIGMTVKQIRNTRSTVCLAAAWYNADGSLLYSNSPKANPRGWRNGTYSYFGLVSEQVPQPWTKYSISFGLHEPSNIPAQARFVRVGALLNYNATPSAVVQLTEVNLFEKSPPRIGLAVPNSTSVFSCASQAALLSTHWPPQQVLVDRGGTKEIQSAAKADFGASHK